MTPEQIAAIGPAFAEYLEQVDEFFPSYRSRKHLQTLGQGVLSDLSAKSIEPIALAAGTGPRALQFFLSNSPWDHQKLQTWIAQRVAQREIPADDPFGAIALVDEQADPKCGDKTPGVQRQWCGHEGKVENCVVCVHLAWACGEFKCILDNDLYLPKSWSDNRDRCREAHIPDDVTAGKVALYS